MTAAHFHAGNPTPNQPTSAVRLCPSEPGCRQGCGGRAAAWMPAGRSHGAAWWLKSCVPVRIPLPGEMASTGQVQHLVAQVEEIAMVDQLFPALPLPRAELRCAAPKVRVSGVLCMCAVARWRRVHMGSHSLTRPGDSPNCTLSVSSVLTRLLYTHNTK